MKGGGVQMEGQKIGGRYDIEKKIGEGGMAVVYRARDTLLNRTVALKVLRSQFGNDDDFIARFHREAQAAASLSHPHVVNIYDIGQEGEMYYIVMEYVEGMTLKQYINEHAPLDVKQAVNIAIQICDALDHAHQNELIHRDIKPHNILINRYGRIKVTDFGIARAVSSVTITHTGSVLGSVHYFSPEQAKGIMAGAKSDLYSLGVVLYEMLTGTLPFSGDSPISVALKHLQEPYIPPRKLRPDLPQSVENIIIRSLAKDPMYRFESANEMLEELRTCLLPERRDEPVYLLPEKYAIEEDPEITRIIPAIKPEMMRKKSWDEPEEARPVKEWRKASTSTESAAVKQNSAQEPEEDEDESVGRSWKRVLAWGFGIVLFLTLAFVGSFYGFTLLNVPDVTTPAVEKLSLQDARQKLEAVGLKPVIQQQFDPTVEADHVIKQTPPANMSVKKDSEVQLIVSQGKQKAGLPNFVGKNIDDLADQLRGYKNVRTEEEANDSQPAGTVLSQTPEAGAQVVADETEIVLTVSKGGGKIVMPNLVGLTEEEMKTKMSRLGLKIQSETKSSYQPQGTVIDQSYRADTELKKGTWVRVTVSSGLPDEARRVRTPVQVYLNAGETATIEIRVTDASGKNRMVEKTPISQSMEFKVPIVVTPSQEAVIQVFRDGQQIDEKHIGYNDAQ